MSSTPSVSLAQVRELYNLLGDIETKLDSLESKTEKATIAYADLYNMIQDVFIILKRMGLPDDVATAINVLQRMIVTLNSLRIAIMAMDTAMAGSPAGMLLAGLGIAISLVSMMDIAGSYG